MPLLLCQVIQTAIQSDMQEIKVIATFKADNNLQGRQHLLLFWFLMACKFPYMYLQMYEF
jgi:hypothetical protein